MVRQVLVEAAEAAAAEAAPHCCCYRCLDLCLYLCLFYAELMDFAKHGSMRPTKCSECLRDLFQALAFAYFPKDLVRFAMDQVVQHSHEQVLAGYP